MTNNIKSKLTELIEKQINDIVELRHKLHQVPEPGFSETQTAAIIADEQNIPTCVRTRAGIVS